MRILWMLTVMIGAGLFSWGPTTQAWAKGLDSLSDKNPETEAQADDEKDQNAQAGDENDDKAAEKETQEEPAKVAAVAQPPSETSKAMAEKLFLSTSFGLVKASKASGSWESSGVSDVTLGYKLPMQIADAYALAATYRYAPIAISGEEDQHLYRGVWEMHNLGARGIFHLNQTTNILGSVEIAYVMASLRPVDNLPLVEKHASNGMCLNLGAGADFNFGSKDSSQDPNAGSSKDGQIKAMGSKPAYAFGPRVYLGFGSYQVFQLGAAASFLF